MNYKLINLYPHFDIQFHGVLGFWGFGSIDLDSLDRPANSSLSLVDGHQILKVDGRDSFLKYQHSLDEVVMLANLLNPKCLAYRARKVDVTVHLSKQHSDCLQCLPNLVCCLALHLSQHLQQTLVILKAHHYFDHFDLFHLFARPELF